MKILITGGAGFIGSNLTYSLLNRGDEVTIYDNLSRKKVKNNLIWLRENKYHNKLKIIIDDVRNRDILYKAVKNKDAIFHLAAQVAVTDSISNPLEDFEVNTIGAINVLEGIRRYSPHAIALYSSTNKVYGIMEKLKDREITNGINESFPLDFHSPYACSKGAADLYFYDFARIYGIKTVVFRQSCIYGNRQFGNEDQGWVMHFMKNILQEKEITIYGDGKQIRDILYIDDLVDAYLLAINNIDDVAGNIYNIGGGASNKVSLLELIKIIENKFKKKANYSFKEIRPGDQKLFFSSNRKIHRDLGWKPKILIDEGLDKLCEWVNRIS